MVEIFLTKGIGNEDSLDGYIDEVVAEIKAVPEDESLRMLITSYGGDTAQGDRIDRAIREHKGTTEAMIIGAAASMAMNILPAFNKRYSDPDAELMIHKARYIDSSTGQSVPFVDLSSNQQNSIKKNSVKMYGRYSAIGVDEDFLSDVYLSEDMDDHFLTPKEAEILGILEVKPVESEIELSLAASHSNYKLTSESDKMGFLNKKKKPVMQVAELESGGMVAFTAVENKIEKGVKLSAVGTEEPLGSSVLIKGGLKASLDEEGEVVAMEEVEEPKAAITDESFADLATRVADIETAVAAINEAMGESKKVDEEAKADEEVKAEEEDEKMKSVEAAAATVSAAAQDVLNAASTISTSARLDKIEDRNEPAFSGLSAEQERIAAMNKIAKGISLNTKLV
jgi:ATP-dependent protease ClpP protease subunit